jgi:predicted transcriptional regulator
MARMQRTQIYLEPELAEELDRVARRRGISRAELIRQAAREFVHEAERPLRGIIGIAEGPDDGFDIESDHDELLDEWARVDPS